MKFAPVILLLLTVVACRSVPPGDTVAQQRAYIDAWEQETLEMLYAAHPETRESIAQAPAYLAVKQRLVKIPLLGGGGGHGVLVDRTRNQRLYAKVDRLDVGGGWGTRNLRVVVVFQDPGLLRNVGKPHWSIGWSAETSAKSGESGAAAGQGKQSRGYRIYELTDEGVSVTWTLYTIKISPYDLLN